MSEGIARTSGEVGKKERTGVYIQRSEEYYDRAEAITKTTAAYPTIRELHTGVEGRPPRMIHAQSTRPERMAEQNERP